MLEVGILAGFLGVPLLVLFTAGYKGLRLQAQNER